MRLIDFDSIEEQDDQVFEEWGWGDSKSDLQPYAIYTETRYGYRQIADTIYTEIIDEDKFALFLMRFG